MRSGACSLEIERSLSNPASKTSVMNKGFLNGSDTVGALHRTMCMYAKWAC